MKMKLLGSLLFFSALPFFGASQTVHVEENKIVYKGTVKLENGNQADLFARAKMALADHVNKNGVRQGDDKKETIVSEGMIRLNSPYHLIKMLHYIVELTVADGKYQYRIDSVYLEEKERGGAAKRISSEELLKGMDSTGEVASNTEKQLNEIDMNFQKLIDLIATDMKKVPRN